MTLAELIEAVRRNVDDALKTLHPQDQFYVNAINQAYRDIYANMISEEIYLVEECLTISQVSGTQEYLLGETTPTTADKRPSIQKVVLVRDNQMRTYPIRDQRSALKSAQECYYVRRSVDVDTPADMSGTYAESYYLGYFRTPDFARTLTVTYVPKFQPYTIDKPLEVRHYIPEEHLSTVINLATVYTLGQDEKNVQFWFGMYQQSLAMLISSLGPITRDGQMPLDVYDNDGYDPID